jgi:subtilisin
MAPNDWSRRTLLKSAATGAVVLGLGAGAVQSTGRYIVGTEPGEDDAVTAAMSVSDSTPDRIDLGPYGTLVEGVFSTARRQSLLGREDVAFVQRDHVMEHPTPQDGSDGDDRATDGQVLPWGIDRVDADVAHAEGRTGEDVHVGIIDGGIDGNHADLQENLAPAGEDNHRAWQECSGDHCDEPWYDDGDHGTHVAGTVAAADRSEGVVGVAPEATLHALKVCGSAGRCRTSDIAEAIKFAADTDVDVVNLSLGSPRESPALRSAGQYAREQGLVLVAAAGNAGPCEDCVGFPAAYDEFIAVSATTIDDEMAAFSSAGEEVDVAAPGADVCSGVVGGHGVFDGTSMASPHVTGAVAQLIAQGYEDDAVRERLTGTAEDIDEADTAQGAGLLDVAAALDLDSSDDGTGDGTACPS